MMMVQLAGVTTLIHDSRKALAELTPTQDDPLFTEIWRVLEYVVFDAGSRLMESRFGGLIDAAEEVALYVAQLERVTRVAAEAPVRVPLLAARPLRAAGRLLEQTRSGDEIIGFLVEVPGLTAAFAEYLTRTAGIRARPLVDVLDLATRSGAVFVDCLERCAPGLSIPPNS